MSYQTALEGEEICSDRAAEGHMPSGKQDFASPGSKVPQISGIVGLPGAKNNANYIHNLDVI